MTIPLLYPGSVKDVRGPIRLENEVAVVFDYSDAYSVFDWGRMPDTLPGKGAALAIIASDWFEKLARAETWREFSRSPDALALRRGNRFGSAFNEQGEILQNLGLKTHYLGVLEKTEPTVSSLAQVMGAFQQVAVRAVSVVKPELTQVAGRTVPDYGPTRSAAYPRLIPLEVIFRFSCPEGSSLLERVSRDPGYLAQLGYAGLNFGPGVRWDFPVLELFTKLESSDRPLTHSEALAISGLTGAQLQEVLFKTAWIAGWIKGRCSRAGLELADGKLEWALEQDGSVILVDAIGPDELRILSKEGVQLSKEFLRSHYRKSTWYESVVRAKTEASARGSADWKKMLTEKPQPLPVQTKELGSQLYQALANELTERCWFAGAWALEKVISELNQESHRS